MENIIFMTDKIHEKPLDDGMMIQHAQEWNNEHGWFPSYSYLKKLAEEGTIESRDQLLEIAERFDIKYDRATTPLDLVEKIRLFMNLNPSS
jgi:hypothetical protein